MKDVLKRDWPAFAFLFLVVVYFILRIVASGPAPEPRPQHIDTIYIPGGLQ